MMAGATEHSHNKDLLTTVAFMNIGLMESAFEGKQAHRHLTSIKKQASELMMLHFVTVLCFVEVGALRVGLKPESKDKFEEAVTAGAAEHGHADLTFL